MALNEAFEMREFHRQLLARHRVYLLHNIRPTEALWATFMAKGLFNQDMIEDIRANRTMSEKIGFVLDLLPFRGPTAFDQFCEVLLECDHSHVAEYLKTLEATDQFKSEIQPHCHNFSDHVVEKFVNIFKRSTPLVQRFAERKFEMMLAEQESDLNQKEEEVKELESQNMYLQLEVTQLRTFLNSCSETSENLANEVQREFLSASFLKEEKKHLENMKYSLKDINGFEKICGFYGNMQILLNFLESFAGVKNMELSINSDKNKNANLSSNSNKKLSGSLQDKMQSLLVAVSQLIEETGMRTQVPGLILRTELEKILRRIKEIMSDVSEVKDMFKGTMRQKRKLETESLSLLHNFREIRRLERELNEKQNHILELNQHGQQMKKKSSKVHKKQLEQIHITMQQKKIQTSEIQKTMERHLNSADVRLHKLFKLLPDLEDNEHLGRSDTDLTVSTRSNSRVNTPDIGTMSGRATPMGKSQHMHNPLNVKGLQQSVGSALGISKSKLLGRGHDDTDGESEQETKKPKRSNQQTKNVDKSKDSVSNGVDTENRKALENECENDDKNTNGKDASKSNAKAPIPSHSHTNRFIKPRTKSDSYVSNQKPMATGAKTDSQIPNQKPVVAGAKKAESNSQDAIWSRLAQPKRSSIAGQSSKEVKKETEQTSQNPSVSQAPKGNVVSHNRPLLLMKRHKLQEEENEGKVDVENEDCITKPKHSGRGASESTLDKHQPLIVSAKLQSPSDEVFQYPDKSKQGTSNSAGTSSSGSSSKSWNAKKVLSQESHVNFSEGTANSHSPSHVASSQTLNSGSSPSMCGATSPDKGGGLSARHSNLMDNTPRRQVTISYAAPHVPESAYQPLPKPPPRQSLTTNRIELRLPSS